MIRNLRYINSLVSIAIILFWTSCQSNESANETEAKRPNIVIIYMDDLGYGDLSAYGATELSTPNMDRLANEGVRFTNAYATSATCTPSRLHC